MDIMKEEYEVLWEELIVSGKSVKVSMTKW